MTDPDLIGPARPITRAIRALLAAATLIGAIGWVPLTVPVASAQSSTEIELFCANIADDARERRYAIQRQELEQLRADIDRRIATLQERSEAFEQWIERRQAFAQAANEGLVQVYGAMRPDAAAQRMEELPADLSAALLTKLKPRVSAAILNEMDAQNAATITKIMAAAADTTLPDGDS